MSPKAGGRALCAAVGRALAAGLLALAASGAIGLGSEVVSADGRFVVSDAMIPMRDGVRLHAKIFTPKDAAGPLPIILLRTPYGVEDAEGNFKSYLKALADDGYIFAFQDIRGKFGSEGIFVMQRPARPPGDTKSLDEGTDTYDTIDWLVKNVPGNNGRVGMLGISYEGWTTIMAVLEPHPALKAVSPQASPADMWLGDDFHHNGAFRLSYGFEYAFEIESAKELEQFRFDRYDTYDWYLALGPLSNVEREVLPRQDPDLERLRRAPELRRVLEAADDGAAPARGQGADAQRGRLVGPGGLLRPAHDLRGAREARPRNRNFLVVGPWNHGGWGGRPGDKLGAIAFDSATGEVLPRPGPGAVVRLLPQGQGQARPARGADVRGGLEPLAALGRVAARQNVQTKNLYFGPGATLSFEPPVAPASGEAFDAYLSDPAHPVPYRHRPIQPTYFPHGSKWPTWLVEDQRFVTDRPDVLSWETPPLADGRDDRRAR